MRPTRSAPAAVILAVLAAPVPAQAPPQDKIDAAIDTGCKALLARVDDAMKDFAWATGSESNAAWTLYTLVIGRADRNDPSFGRLLNFCLDKKLERTYYAATLAMALEALDRTKYRGQIERCAQFLIDNQCVNGQWDYGQEVPLPKITESIGGSGSGGGKPGATAAKTRLKRQAKTARASGDNSTTQFALLGLRAAEDAGFEVPSATWQAALTWWASCQRQDGGWNYGEAPTVRSEASFPAMTEGGLGSTILCLFHLGRKWENSPSVKAAQTWIGKNFDLERNPLPRAGADFLGYQYYHLFALQRAGQLAETKVFGPHTWYDEGAAYLLGKQKPDGSWLSVHRHGNAIHDTCFAVLFLARATRAVVYSKSK